MSTSTEAEADAREYIMFLVWTLLSLAPRVLINPTFLTIISSAAVLEQLCPTSITLAPGLLDVVQSDNLPTIAFFKNLPTDFKKKWGVYLLVFEKFGCTPKIYVGSGTESVGGVSKRLQQYDAKSFLPRYVELALDDGYLITHKGLLAWIPLPTVTARFPMRVLMMAIEAMFSLVLWAMKSRDKDYGMPHLCRWSIESLDYEGLCSHVALNEGIVGESDNFTPEELLALEAVRLENASQKKKTIYFNAKEADWDKWKETRRRYEAKRDVVEKRATTQRCRDNNVASGKYACTTCGFSFCSKYLLESHLGTPSHRDMVNGVQKTAAQMYYAENVKKNIVTGKYPCKPCGVNFSDNRKLDTHKKSQLHRDTIAKLTGVPSTHNKPHKCKVCGTAYDLLPSLKRHYKSKLHIQNVALAAQA